MFLDRDGTIIEDGHYISRLNQVRLIDGAAIAIARINAASIPVIVVTNQSGIGRGFFPIADYEQLVIHLGEMLAVQDAHLDASYHCPHAPEDACNCRKPGGALFEQAARERPGIDLGCSLYIGDRWRDIAPGIAFGGTGVLVPSPETPRSEIDLAGEKACVAKSMGQALDWYLAAG